MTQPPLESFSQQQPPAATSASPSLPFNPRNLLIGLVKRWPFFLLIALIAGGLGVAGGVQLGERMYEASTVLLYRPADAWTGRTGLPTQIGLVGLTSTLTEVRERLEMPIAIDELRKAIRTRVERGTSLVTLSARWNSPQVSRSIVRTTREVFLENQQRMRRAMLAIQVRDVENRLESARLQFRRADRELEDFQTTNRILSVDLETQRVMGELAQLDRAHERTRLDRYALEAGLHSGNLEGLANIRATSGGGSLTEADFQIELISRAIEGDRTYQSRQADLAEAERQFAEAETWKELGLISAREYENRRNAYERRRAMLEESEVVKELKQELLEAMDGRLRELDKTRRQVNDKLDNLPALQRQYAALQREVTFWNGQQGALEQELAQLRRSLESTASDFSVISDVSVDARASSTRRSFAMGIAVLIGIFGFGTILAVELLNTAVRSGSEVQPKLAQPLLGVIPRLKPDGALFSQEPSAEYLEPLRIMARKIRQTVSQRGARILVVSATPGEGVTSVLASLAVCFGRQDERVLAIDAQVRGGEHQHELRELIVNDGTQIRGLGDYLSFEIEDAAKTIWPTRLPGVECIPHVGEAVRPELLGSTRMHELLDELSNRFSLILIDTPPVLPYVDADLLAQWADAIILVVRSQKGRPAGKLKKAVERLKSTQTPIAGVILNQVDPWYMEKN